MLGEGGMLHARTAAPGAAGVTPLTLAAPNLVQCTGATGSTRYDPAVDGRTIMAMSHMKLEAIAVHVSAKQSFDVLDHDGVGREGVALDQETR